MAKLAGGAGSGGAIGIGAFMNEQPLVKGISNIVGSLGGLTSALAVAGGAMAAMITQDAIQEAIQYEQELADLAKILGNRDIAEPIMESISELSTEMPIARQELSAIAEQAVRFGIRGRDNIMEFTRVVGEAAIATDATADQAAEALVKIAAITREPISRIRDLGNVLNELSNTAATSFSELIRASGKIAPILSQMDVPTEDIFALAAATNEVNISVRRGATRLRSFFQSIDDTKVLDQFARAMGRDTDAMVELLDKSGGAMKILANMSQIFREGGSDARMLSQALTNAADQGVASLSQNLPGLFKHLKTAAEEIENGTSLADEYAQRVNTAAAKHQLLSNNINESQRELGMKLLPTYKNFLDVLVGVADALDEIGRSGFLDKVLAQDEVKEMRDELDQAFESQSKFFKGPSGTLGLAWARKATEQTLNFVNEGIEPAREEFELFVEKLSTDMPEAVRGPFFRGVRNIVRNFNNIEGSSEELSNIWDNEVLPSIARLSAALISGTEAGEDYAELPGKFTMPTGEVVRFTAENEKLINQFRQTTEEMNLNEIETFKLRVGYQNLTDEQKEVIDLLIEQRREAENVVDSMDALNNMLSSVFEGRMFGRMSGQFTRQFENMMSGVELLNQAISENIELRKGQTAARIAAIRGRVDISEQTKEAIIQVLKWNEALEANKEATEDANEEHERLQDRIDDLTFQTQEAQLDLLVDSVQELSGAFMDFIDAAVTGSDDLGDALTDMFVSISETITEQLLQGMLLDFFVNVLGILGNKNNSSNLNPMSSTSLLGGSSIFGALPNRAQGGSALAGKAYMVGEKGAEVFVPRVSGTVLPSDSIGGGKQVNINIQNKFDISAVDGPSVKKMLDQNMDHIATGTARVISQHSFLQRELLS